MSDCNIYRGGITNGYIKLVKDPVDNFRATLLTNNTEILNTYLRSC